MPLILPKKLKLNLLFLIKVYTFTNWARKMQQYISETGRY